MKFSYGILIAGIACLMVIAAGCTGTTQTKTTATPAATASAPPSQVPSAAPPETTAIATTAPATVAATATTTATTASSNMSWDGTWNTTYSTAGTSGITAETLIITQKGTAVTGTYALGNGSVNATVTGVTLAGTWEETSGNTTSSGLFTFTPSADGKTFTGRWISMNETAAALENTTQYWNGTRV